MITHVLRLTIWRITLPPVYYFVLFLSVSGCFLGDGETKFRGSVLNEQSKSIVGAEVTALSDPANKRRLAPPWTVQTKDEGKFKVSLNHAPVKGKIILEVKMKGYESYSKRYEAGKIHANLIIVLKKKQEEPEVAVPLK